MTSAEKSNRQTLHNRISNRLRHEIDARRGGDRLDAEAKLARRFGVSVFTVREALSALAREGLIERRHGSGTYVTDRRDRQHVAVLVEQDLTDPRASQFVKQVAFQARRAALDRGYRARLYVGHSRIGENVSAGLSCPEFFEDLDAGRLLGIMTFATPLHAEWVDRIQATGLPLVGSFGVQRPQIIHDFVGMVREGVRYLVESGRDRLAVLTTVRDRDERLNVGEPVREMCSLHGLAEESVRVVYGLDPADPIAGWRAFQRAWSDANRPEGLLVTDDVLFAGVLQGILAAGVRIPDELLVATHANVGLTPPAPFPVLRLEFDPAEFARTHVDCLLRQIEEPEAKLPRRVVVPFRRVEDCGAAGDLLAEARA